MTIPSHSPCPPPAQPQIFWQTSLNIPDLPLSFLLLFCQPRMCQTARYIWSGLPHQPSFLPSSTIFYHFFSLRFYQFTWHFKQYQAGAVSRSPGWSWQNLKEKMGALNIQYIIFWLILTHFSVISDLKNSQNLHFHQFSPDLFKGGQPKKFFGHIF